MFRNQLSTRFIIIICIIILHINCEEIEYYDYEQYYEEMELIEFCHDIEFDKYIPSPRGDKYYIFCGETANKSYESKCPDNIPIFKNGICDKPNPITTTIIIPTTITKLITKTTPVPIKTTKRLTSTKKKTTVTTTKPTTTTRKTSTIKLTIPTTTTTKKSTTIHTTTRISETTTNRPDFCPQNDNSNYVIFLPSTKNCYEYFICYHGNPLPMYCANKLHYNPLTYKCDFPAQVQCKINESVKPIPKCQTVTKIEFYEHPENCNYFLCCIFGSMSVQQCPYLQHWDFITKSCIPKHMSTLIISCNFIIIALQSQISTNHCNSVPEGSFVKDPYACEKFYQCRNGIGISVSCPIGMFFDPNAEICEISDKVFCQPELLPTEIPTEDIICPKKDDKIHVVFVASKLDCHRYYICYHGVPIKQECIPELHWNQRMNRCDFPENSKCTINQLPKCPESGSTIYPHPTECGYYIYCIDGYASLQQCPFYHNWDVVSRKCVWKNVARCFNTNRVNTNYKQNKRQ